MSSDKTLVVYGLHTVRATFTHASTDVLEAWIKQDASHPELVELTALARTVGVRMQSVGGGALDKLAGSPQHQGIVVRRRTPKLRELADFLDIQPNPARPALLLAIDQLQDPHNLGAALRVADATGVDAVIVTKDRSVGITSAVAKVASGALDTVPLVGVTNLARALADMKAAGVWAVGASHEATMSVYELDLQRPLVWVLGGEGTGLRRLTRDTCDYLARIPMQGTVGSLNLGTAAAVCLFETGRQRAAEHFPRSP
ncbi:MAG: 23S rRNA (guanosine(2251)-2'-O)-methyltransferase RlmB [Gammaproteobacteria bacterium]|nr:23S rRNA (guanosine(2251)-2'-O)-methyltransferase RlmB [Gammaproteobacteria bacterium]